MFRPRALQSSLSIRDKIYSIDYILLLSILILGIISIFAMYSTDGTRHNDERIYVRSPILEASYLTSCIRHIELDLVHLTRWIRCAVLDYILFEVLC